MNDYKSSLIEMGESACASPAPEHGLGLKEDTSHPAFIAEHRCTQNGANPRKFLRILFVGRSAAHFTYYDCIIRSLCARGHKVHLLYDREWSHFDFGETIKRVVGQTPGLTVGWSQRRKGNFRPVVFGLRELKSVNSYLTRKGQSVYYLERWQSYLPSIVRDGLKKTWSKNFVKSSLVRWMLDTFEAITPPVAEIVNELRILQPDVVVASPVNMRFSEEVEYVKAAKTLNIPTVLPVLSWDNLTTKGLIHVKPDLVLAWNDAHRQEAIDIHGIHPDRIVVTGSPFFSKWFENHRLREEREVFLKRLGVDDVTRPMLVYLGSSKNIAKDESWLVKGLSERLRTHANSTLRRAFILVRPHPANADIYRDLAEDNVIVWPRSGRLPEQSEDQRDFYNSLTHAVCALGINTSGMIDAIIHDIPCISILTETYKQTQTQAQHFQHLLQADVLELATTEEEALEKVEALLHGEDHRRVQRAKFIRDFIAPYGPEIAIGDVASMAIEAVALRGQTAIERS